MILVTGDAMIDRYWFGTVTRVCPDAPVQVLAYSREEEREGGAANVALNVNALGGESRTFFSASYRARPVVKMRLVGRTQQLIRVDFDHPQDPIDLVALARAAESCPVSILSDYRKGSIPDTRAAIHALHSSGSLVLVDPKATDPEAYGGADVLKPNHYEMEALVGAWSDEHDLAARAHRLRRLYGIGAIVMTRGERGMSCFDERGTWHVAGRKLDLVDVSGAGDTTIAALAVAIEQRKTMREAVEFANRAAGVASTRFGTTVVAKGDLE